jgi:hypothetical protein
MIAKIAGIEKQGLAVATHGQAPIGEPAGKGKSLPLIYTDNADLKAVRPNNRRTP